MSNYLLFGDDLMRLAKARERLENKFDQVNQLPTDKKELERYLFQGLEFSLFEETTLYVLVIEKDWPSDLIKKISNWAKMLPEDNSLLILSLVKLPQSHPSRRLKNLPWQEVSIILPATDEEWERYLQKRAKEAGVLLSRDAAKRFLQRLSAPNPWRIYYEIHKLSLLSQDTVLTHELIDQVITPIEDIPGYLLNDPFARGNHSQMLQSLTELIKDGRSPISAVMTLARHLRKLLSIHYLWKVHGTNVDITRHMQGHPYALSQWQKQASNINPEKLEEALLRLAKLESELKGMDSRSTRFGDLLLLAGMNQSFLLAHH